MQIHELNKQPTNTLLTEKDVNEVSQAKLASIRKKAVAEKAKDTADYQRAINKALPADPGTNQQAQQAVAPQPAPVQQAANPAQPAPATNSIVGKEPSAWDRVKGLANSRQAGINQRYDIATGNDQNQQQIQQQYNNLKSMGTPGFEKTAATAATAATSARGSNTIPPKVMQQASSGTYISKTNDYETDKWLTQLGFRFK
jgi:hypothetical protein